MKITCPDPIGGGQRELPFVIGVLADLSPNPETPPTFLKDRSFVPIDRASFDAVLKSIQPRLLLPAVELRFQSMRDFEPHRVGAQVGEQRLDLVMRAPEFQRLESTWRGLHYLVSRAAPDARIKILNVNRKTLYKDLLRAPEFDQSGIFKKLHDDIYGVTRPEPFTLLVSDWECDGTPADIELLARISSVSASIHAPLLLGAAPSLFGLDSFQKLGRLDDLSKIFEWVHYAAWRSLRNSEDAQYLGITIPRAWAYAASLAGGDVSVDSDVDLSHRAEQLAKLGFIPPLQGFPLAPSLKKPGISADDNRTAERAIRLDYIMVMSRFAHYIKVIVADHAKGFDSPDACARYLNDWIAQYTGEGRPLRTSHIHLVPQTNPALYIAVLRAEPALQSQSLIWGLRAIVRLQPGKIRPLL